MSVTDRFYILECDCCHTAIGRSSDPAQPSRGLTFCPACWCNPERIPEHIRPTKAAVHMSPDQYANTPFGPLGITFHDPEPRTPDELLELIEDAVYRVTFEHDALDNDSRCRCGVVNNMDGDVLHSHRVGAMMEAIEAVLVQNLHEEQRTLADGEGGMTTDYKTGETTVHSRPCTRQSRWVTPWLGMGA